MNLTKHITYAEAVKSYTANRLGIVNMPTEEHMYNMIVLGTEIFEPLRKFVGGPILITSFYRSEELNKAIGGSKSSQHCTGHAMDIDDVYGHKTNADMFDFIVTHLDFDQIIWEFGDNKNPDWVHVSYVENNNRRNVLKAVKEKGKTIYKPF